MDEAIQLNVNKNTLLTQIKQWAISLGFADVGVSNLDLDIAQSQLTKWVDKGFHGSMDYMYKHGIKRSQPAELIPGTVSILSLRMDYLSETQSKAIKVLQARNLGYVSRYALGRDYHKVIRKRLVQLAKKIKSQVPHCEYRIFTDSAPVMEKPIAGKAGLGWVGKHSNIVNREAGSWFFLGEIYLNFSLDESSARENHCGSCTACIDACPTNAIVEDYVVDARKCLSYLTIENNGDIPLKIRPRMANRIYGCDDCQLYCPWNRFAKISRERDFQSRNAMESQPLDALFAWSEAQFLSRFEGSPIRRIGYQNWLRNIAVALGNADKNTINLNALLAREHHPDARIREHIHWGILEQQGKLRR